MRIQLKHTVRLGEGRLLFRLSLSLSVKTSAPLGDQHDSEEENKKLRTECTVLSVKRLPYKREALSWDSQHPCRTFGTRYPWCRRGRDSRLPGHAGQLALPAQRREQREKAEKFLCCGGKMEAEVNSVSYSTPSPLRPHILSCPK